MFTIWIWQICKNSVIWHWFHCLMVNYFVWIQWLWQLFVQEAQTVGLWCYWKPEKSFSNIWQFLTGIWYKNCKKIQEIKILWRLFELSLRYVGQPIQQHFLPCFGLLLNLISISTYQLQKEGIFFLSSIYLPETSYL